MANPAREIITLQVGHYANYVGTHWWNIQEGSFVYDNASASDINHDFLFREGITAQRQETYTPRLLVIDIKGSLHSLSQQGSLYNPLRLTPSTSEAAWDGPVDLINQLPEEKNEFLMDLEREDSWFTEPPDEDKDICIDDISSESQVRSNSVVSSKKLYDLTKSVKVWSDFLRPHFHPKSIYLLDAHLIQSGCSSGDGNYPCWGFLNGSTIFQREDIEEEITDRIRLLAESCDSLQGFQILSDIHDGMGGISFGILQHLSDEYGSKDSMTFATLPPHLSPSTPQSRVLKQSSIVQSYVELSKLSGVFVPLSLQGNCWDFQTSGNTFPHLSVQMDNAYVSSSVFAAFLDTVSMCYRTRSSPLPMAHIVDLLTPAGRKVTGGSLALPMGITVNHCLFDWLQGGHLPQLQSMTADCDLCKDPLTELQVLRGISSTRLIRCDTKLPPGIQYSSSAQLYRDYLEECGRLPTQRIVTSAKDPLKTISPFPSIFSKEVTEDGYIDLPPKDKVAAVSQVPCIAGLHQGGGIGQHLQQLLTGAEKLNSFKAPQLLNEGLDKEGWLSVVEELKKLMVNYCVNNEDMCCSDDDDDD